MLITLTPSSSSIMSLPIAAKVVHLHVLWAFTAHRLWALNLHTENKQSNSLNYQMTYSMKAALKQFRLIHAYKIKLNLVSHKMLNPQ